MAKRKNKPAGKGSGKKGVEQARRNDEKAPGADSLKLVVVTGVVAVVVVAVMIIAAAALKPKSTGASVVSDAGLQVQPDAKADALNTGLDYKKLFQEVYLKENIPKIDIAEAKHLFDSGRAVFVDTRSKGEYERLRIKGSIFLPTDARPDEIDRVAKKYRGKVLVTYCHGGGCHLADKVAHRLFDAGHRKLAIFWGGWPKWDENKYPESTGL